MLACLNKPSYKQAVGKIGLVGHSLLTTNLEHNLQINTNVVVQCFSVKTLLLITDHWKFKLELTINSLFPIKQEFGFDLLNIHQSLIFESNFTEYCSHYVLLGDMKLFTLSHANFFFFLHLTCLMLKLYLILRGWVKCLVLYIDIHLKKRGTKLTWECVFPVSQYVWIADNLLIVKIKLVFLLSVRLRHDLFEVMV